MDLLLVRTGRDSAKGSIGRDFIHHRASMIIQHQHLHHAAHADRLGGHGLMHLLYRYRSQKCADPRDSICALLEMTKAEFKRQFEIDYAATVEDVYEDATRRIVLDSGQLDIIRCAERYLCSCESSDHDSSKLPSWVPDFAPLVEGLDWSPGGSLKAEIEFVHYRKILRCKGLLLGTIGKVYPPHELSKRQLPLIPRQLLLFAEGAFLGQGRELPEDPHEVFRAMYKALYIEGKSYLSAEMPERRFVMPAWKTLVKSMMRLS